MYMNLKINRVILFFLFTTLIVNINSSCSTKNEIKSLPSNGNSSDSSNASTTTSLNGSNSGQSNGVDAVSTSTSTPATSTTPTPIEATASAEATAYQNFTLRELNMARTNPKAYAKNRLSEEYNDGDDNGAYNDLIYRTAIPPLKFNKALNQAASNYAKFLAENNLFSHEEDGTPSSRCKRAGYPGLCAENLASDSSDDNDATINAEMAAINFVKQLIIDRGNFTRGHRKIILDADYTVVGIGYSKHANFSYGNVTVQNFGEF
ncbi:MAG: CAP domain-containing protein [Oligoflexia bacterium]|nr:CAP domain-containing protein [Oligoflexia bacterium]